MNNNTIHNVSTSHNFTIEGLEEDSSYTITVLETNAAGSAIGDPIAATTLEAGEVNGSFEWNKIEISLLFQFHLVLQ